MTYKKFSEMKNIGKSLELKLINSDIKKPEDLLKLGSRNAFLQILIFYPGSCINILYALEGAVQNIRWHHIQKNDKFKLKNFYNSLK